MAPSLVQSSVASPITPGSKAKYPGSLGIDQLLGGPAVTSDEVAVFLTRRIEFKESTRPDTKMDNLRKKYRPINAKRLVSPTALSRTLSQGAAAGSKQPDLLQPLVDPVSGFRRGAHSLFQKSRLTPAWQSVRKVGPGLQNLGNTCFLNSVLQCLTYTPPLANYLLSQEHSRQCRQGNVFCMMCELERHVIRSFELNQQSGAICPKKIVGSLKAIAKHMRVGRQEDSHEFLRYVVEAMQASCLNGLNSKIDARVKETTLVHAIFGGYLQSQIRCSRCHADSNTFDPLLDLSLEVRNCSSIQRALSTFTKPELLDGRNKYKCDKCQVLVEARKQLTIYQTPEVLTIQLKRFDFGHSMFGGGKINKHIEYPETLDLAPYISPSRKGVEMNTRYSLYGVLVHSGSSCHSGHYYCYIKATSGAWYCMDDSSVSSISLKQVLAKTAYLLFYTRCPASATNPADPAGGTRSLTPQAKRLRQDVRPARHSLGNTLQKGTLRPLDAASANDNEDLGIKASPQVRAEFRSAPAVQPKAASTPSKPRPATIPAPVSSKEINGLSPGRSTKSPSSSNKRKRDVSSPASATHVTPPTPPPSTTTTSSTESKAKEPATATVPSPTAPLATSSWSTKTLNGVATTAPMLPPTKEAPTTAQGQSELTTKKGSLLPAGGGPSRGDKPANAWAVYDFNPSLAQSTIPSVGAAISSKSTTTTTTTTTTATTKVTTPLPIANKRRRRKAPAVISWNEDNQSKRDKLGKHSLASVPKSAGDDQRLRALLGDVDENGGSVDHWGLQKRSRSGMSVSHSQYGTNVSSWNEQLNVGATGLPGSTKEGSSTTTFGESNGGSGSGGPPYSTLEKERHQALRVLDGRGPRNVEPSRWDQTLDQGRVKKRRNKDKSAPDSENRFQTKQSSKNRRKRANPLID